MKMLRHFYNQEIYHSRRVMHIYADLQSEFRSLHNEFQRNKQQDESDLRKVLGNLKG